MEPRIAKSLDRLRAQIRAAVPSGPPLSEYGWIGDAAHRNRVSDHNPDELGVVRALDVPHDPASGLDTYELANYMRDVADQRLKYLISNRRIWNPAISKAWRVYNGANAHDRHLHVSVVKDARADDSRDWDLDEVLGAPPEEIILRPLLKRGMKNDEVRLIQQALMVDKIFGPLTEEAVRRFQAQEELDDDGIVGPLTWRALEYRYPDIFKPIERPPVEKPTEEDWQTSITATVFGGSAGMQRSAYDNHIIDENELGAALPFRFTERPVLEVRSASKIATDVAVIDVGPWMTDNDYWTHGERPIAETCHRNRTPLPSGPHKGNIPTNDAGIDLTPALAKALGIDGKGKVDWRIAPS